MSSSIVYTRIPGEARHCNCDEALAYGVADLHEGMGVLAGRRGLMAPAMRGLNAGLRIAGPAVTAYCDPGDNLMVQKALRLAEPGHVVVLSNGGYHHGALFGEMMGTYVMERKLAGIIVDGPIRDVDALREMRVPIWSTSVSPTHPERRGPGSVNTPIPCAGIIVNPGDIIVADSDGVIAISPRTYNSVLQAARERAAKEAAVIAALKRGEHLFEAGGADKVWSTLDIEERDTDWESWERRTAGAPVR